MKDLIKIFKSDYESEHFTVGEWVIYGVLIPTIMIVGIAMWAALE